MMCRDELQARGIALDTLSDWHGIHGRCKTPERPIRLVPLRSGQVANSHVRVERRNKDFGQHGVSCGEKGWLQTETLDGWFERYGRPIAQDSDVQRLRAALLQPALDLSAQRKVDQLQRSLS
eukprot:CAMPEP_0179272136 /NCGR_PEP_ID=MMETSP0797-20121207/32338_1 /TAXON_ID=47934 /ORGANISM="Dinophysis acuminata, Strain DAEP01" /LENGTH=121 /DNA_ID=CAMNT_0020980515 /DNA_START=69 /DNA_END=430 /DNA_ORIENTATION=+